MPGTMSGTSIKMENSEEGMGVGGGGGGGGKSWGRGGGGGGGGRGGGGGGRDRDSPSEGGGGGPPGENKKRSLDPQLWHACAGGMVQLPPVGAKVMYFPQGHGEQAATPPEFPRTMVSKAIITCKVISVSFLADTETDEVYARIRLQPMLPEPPRSLCDAPADADEAGGHRRSPTPEKPASFAKTLTQSDANNGGGFSVPRYCAETIFPPLDYTIDPPVQTVLAKDVHGERWKFRHIYRGTPRRHLLTTGWSTFVNQKKLVAGDAIVFLRTALGELCVGVRRSMRSNGGSDSSTWSGGGSSQSASASGPHHHHSRSRWEVKGTESFSVDYLGGDSAVTVLSPGNGVGRSPGLGIGSSGPRIGAASGGSSSSTSSSFARNRARVTAQSVLEAASLAISGQPFEVVYYPRASTAEFCVKEAAVKVALDQQWYPGMRFKMAFETEDSSRISWFMGTITAVQPADPLWAHSPWRVLQVNWDEPDLLQGVTRVSPWQVEMVATLPMQMPPFSVSKKKLRVTQASELALSPGQGMMGMGLPLAGIPTVFGQFSAPWPPRGFIHMEEASAGMQGARHERFYGVAALQDQFRPPPHIPSQPGLFSADSGFFHQTDASPRACHVVDQPPRAAPPYPVQCRPDSNLDSITNFLGKASCQETERRQTAAAAAAAASPKASTSSNSFVLFGNTINPDSKSHQPHQSGGSPSSSQHPKVEAHTGKTEGGTPPSLLVHPFKELYPFKEESATGGKRKSSPSESSQTDACDWVQKPAAPSAYPNGKVNDLKWFGWGQDRGAGEQKPLHSLGESLSHCCKVFRESDEVGRTVDLYQFASYADLYERIASMFNIEGKLLQNAMVYKDASGSTKHVGLEPYRSFAKSARRLIILSDRSAGEMRE